MSDREDERMDRILAEASAAAVPALPANFEARLAKSLRPRRLSFGARLVMTFYTVVALAISVWALRPVPLIWIVRVGLPLISFSLAWASWRFWRDGQRALFR